MSKGIDVSVSPKKLFNSDNGSNPPAFDQALVLKAAQVPGVKKASGGVFDDGTIVGNNGKKVNGNTGAPNFITNPSPAPFDPFHYVSGHAPTANNTIAIDSFTAKKQHWHVGSVVRVGGQGPTQPYTVVGVGEVRRRGLAGRRRHRDHASPAGPEGARERSAGSTASTSRQPTA